ncbi:hypothetical protein EV356DRAFT_525605 [Viridothelium virens]|uniref:Uncharacterized protein n=1 Tax=Viridothelium virens TaxID=1048519 RepID=A0A6A6H2B9_VIRVR|nr:hypothetical protein EV356DRAFT_525605 [Viridothelium virens]
MFSSSLSNVIGWVPESPGRGTLTLIISCLFTIFLCTWVVIHPRITKNPLRRLLHKAALFVKAVLAPELIAVEGLQEWNQGRKMVENCKNRTEGDLKLVQAFYIGMLALRYRTERGDRVIWPNQYEWLLNQGLVSWNDHERWGLSKENIRDKSNADSTVKLFAAVQVSWFVAQSIMRAAHDLPLSQLESMTLSYVPLFAVTYFFWWTKPKDILTPSLIDLPNMSEEKKTAFEALAISNTFDDEHLDEQDSIWTIWKLTPRVFEKEAKDRAMREFIPRKSDLDWQKEAHGSDHNNPELPEETVLAYWDPDCYHSKIWPVTCLFGASFGALHLISWNTEFPTFAEQWLWRAAAITSTVSLLIFMQYEKVVLRWGGPLTLLSIVSPVFYLLSRVVMMGGIIAAFRAMDPKIYDTYVVSTYWIHTL